MPFIDVKTNSDKVLNNQEAIKTALGEAITAIPGKSEAWLMVRIEYAENMWFKGDSAPCAMFDVSVFGTASDAAYDDLTQRICSVAEQYLAIPASRVYVKYSETEHWGWNNMNF